MPSEWRCFGPDRLSRASLRWYINQTLYAVLTPTLAASLTIGDAAVIVPATSKADPFGLNFGPHPIYLPYDASSPITAAVHLADMELRFPCSNRADVPLFTADGRRRSFSHTLADQLLHSCLTSVLPHDRVSCYSMHSFRIGLACALLTAGASQSEIMARLRWSDPSMTTIYARPNPADAMRSISQAMTASVSSTTASHLPRFDSDHVAMGLHALGSGLESIFE